MTAQPPRIADPGEDRGVAVEAQDGEIGIGIVADQIRREAAPVGERGLDLGCAIDDVAVGQDIGIGREDDAGTGAARALLCTADLEMQDRGSDLVDGADNGARIGVEQHQILGRGGRDRNRRGVGLAVADRIENGGEIGIHDKNKVGTLCPSDKMRAPDDHECAGNGTAQFRIFRSIKTQVLSARFPEFSKEIGPGPVEVVHHLVQATIGRKVGPTDRVQCPLGSRDHSSG